MLTIKPVSIEDAYQIHLQIPEFKDRVPLEKFQAQLATTSDQHIVIAYLSEKPIGYMVSYDRFKDGSIYCWMTGVTPEARGQGALKVMIADLIEWAKAKNFQELKIKTRNARREMLNFLVKNDFNFLEVEQRKLLKNHRILLNKIL